MISPPPPITRDSSTPSSALFVLVGLAGIAAAIAFAPADDLDFYAQRGLIPFLWGSAPSIAAVAALAGGILALMRSECGPPIVAGAGAVLAVVVGVSVTSTGFDLQDFIDSRGLRAIGLLVAGALGVVCAVLGLIAGRGRGNPGIAVGITVLALGGLAADAVRTGLDEAQTEFNVRPFVAMAVLAAVAIIGAFVGRYGALVAAIVYASLIPLYLQAAKIDTGRERYAAVVGMVLAFVGIVALAMVAAVISSRRAPAFGHQTSTYGTDQPYGNDPTQQMAQYGAYGPATEQVPAQPGIGQQPYGQQPYGQQPYGQAIGEQFAAQHDDGQAHDVWGNPALTSTATPSVGPDSTPMSTMGTTGETAASTTADTTAVSTVGQWAADPYGRHQLRYWDGSRWTDNVSTNGVSSLDPV